MCTLESEGYAEVWREVPRIARKPRECWCCDSLIAAAQPYLSHFSVYDGRASNEQLCVACWWSRKVFSDAHDYYPMPGGFWEVLQNCIGEEDESEAEWRAHFAAIKRRYRVSQVGRRRLRLDVWSHYKSWMQ